MEVNAQSMGLIFAYLFAGLVSYLPRHGKGPYYVEFTLKFQGHTDSASFVVELPSRKQLPHSVFTFLSLVESNLFDGTAFLSTNDSIMNIGKNPESSALLDQKFKALGFGQSALSFIEDSSDFRCESFSVGFVGLGPALELFLSDDYSSSNRSCFGIVVRGMQTLSRVETTVENGETVDIVEVRHLVLDR
jgi:cyclophilin family peptidyl-prolyl cis-trans isomerase